ncbi:MAG: prephenate dehydrogenase [Armatimonadota bacterium]|nr:prephenate dehydrogenase [bacterium]
MSEDNFIFDTIAIVGVGLIGGSLGMAVKKRRLARRVVGIGRTEQKLMRAKILGAIDHYSMDIEKGAEDADLVVVCTPVSLIAPTLQRMAASFKAGAIVTDVGSTKSEVVRQAESVLPEGVHFVGGHPMAGSEQAGVEAAFADLFLGATYVFTPGGNTDFNALGRLTELADAIGSNVEIMTPDDHDRATAIISHLPHVMSAALLGIAEQAQHESGKVFALAAGSFRDLTRISDSSPELWRDIVFTNKSALLQAIGMLQGSMADFKLALIENDEEAVMRFFEQAGIIRQTFQRISK